PSTWASSTGRSTRANTSFPASVTSGTGCTGREAPPALLVALAPAEDKAREVERVQLVDAAHWPAVVVVRDARAPFPEGLRDRHLKGELMGDDEIAQVLERRVEGDPV